MENNIKTFKDLIFWQKSHFAAMRILNLAKKSTRASITYEIWRQIIRSAFSVGANIAEGFNSHKGLTYLSHLEIAKGSAAETEYWLIVLFESGDISKSDFELLEELYTEIAKMLSASLSTLKSKTNH